MNAPPDTLPVDAPPDHEPDPPAASEPERALEHAEPEPEGKPRRHTRRPANPAGWYMVIAAPSAREGYAEVGWYKAHGPDHAKRQAVGDAERGHLLELKETLQGAGVYLRAVPAQSWPKVERTGYDVPAPRLRIG